jgi:hypothetical protein
VRLAQIKADTPLDLQRGCRAKCTTSPPLNVGVGHTIAPRKEVNVTAPIQTYKRTYGGHYVPRGPHIYLSKLKDPKTMDAINEAVALPARSL